MDSLRPTSVSNKDSYIDRIVTSWTQEESIEQTTAVNQRCIEIGHLVEGTRLHALEKVKKHNNDK